MAKFCTKCGSELGTDGQCPNCPPGAKSDLANSLDGLKGFLSSLQQRMGLSNPEDEKVGIFERGKKIVPDVIATNEDEIPIRQYNVAKLRSRILGKYAEGRLQLTNKRVIFRAVGTSYTGKQVLQYEFSINEIGGIEVKKSNRFSLFSLIIAFVLSIFVMAPFESFFTTLNESSSVASIVLGNTLALACLIPFFVLRKKFWIKLIATSAGFGAANGMTSLSASAFDFMLGKGLLESIGVVPFILCSFWLFNLILVSLVPDLRICLKTKGAGDSATIRRKIWGLFLKQHTEYTDFSEVIPWVDTDKAITEIGAIIDDLHTSGDYAIEKWKV